MAPADLDFLVIIHEGERERDVQLLASDGGGRPLPRLEGHHQVDPSARSLRFEHIDEVGAEDLDQQRLKRKINS